MDHQIENEDEIIIKYNSIKEMVHRTTQYVAAQNSWNTNGLIFIVSFKAEFSNPAGELPSYRFQLQPQSNSPESANQRVGPEVYSSRVEDFKMLIYFN